MYHYNPLAIPECYTNFLAMKSIDIKFNKKAFQVNANCPLAKANNFEQAFV